MKKQKIWGQKLLHLYIFLDYFVLNNPNVSPLPKIKQNESCTKQRWLTQEKIKRRPYLIWTTNCMQIGSFAWFCLSYTLHLAHFNVFC